MIDEKEQARIDALIDAEINTEEQKKERFRAAAKRRAQDPEWRAKHAAEQCRRSQDPEWRAKCAEANRRSAQDPEWRAKCAEANRRSAQDPEWLAKCAEANRRSAQDPEWRAKNAETQRRRAVAVVCIETGVVYEGLSDAHRKTGINLSSISSACSGRIKTAGGYHWRYATPEEIEEYKKSHAGA